eukprot:11198549-Lingulodinium_polyedra.AAC.1
MPDVGSKKQRTVPFKFAFNYTQHGPDSELNLKKDVRSNCMKLWAQAIGHAEDNDCVPGCRRVFKDIFHLAFPV